MNCEKCKGLGYYRVNAKHANLSSYEVIQWTIVHAMTCEDGWWRTKNFLTLNWKKAFKSCDGWHTIPCQCTKNK